MRKQVIRIQTARPRNLIVRALVNKLTSVAAGRHADRPSRRRQNQDNKDLDQRVREIGEW